VINDRKKNAAGKGHKEFRARGLRVRVWGCEVSEGLLFL